MERTEINPGPDIQALLDKTRRESNTRLMGMYGELKMTPSEWQNGKNPQQTLSVPPVTPKKQNNNVNNDVM